MSERWLFRTMSAVAQPNGLPSELKQALLWLFAIRLRPQRARMHESRKFPRERMAAWIADNEADRVRFREGRLR